MFSSDRLRGYRLGDLTIDLDNCQIRRNGDSLPCGRLTFELLVALAERAPRLVGKHELIDCLWSARYVSPATVKRRFSLLRSTLGDQAETPKYVRVVRGKGYSIIPKVTELRPKRDRRRRIAMASAAASLIAAFCLGAEIGYQDGLQPHMPGYQTGSAVYVTSAPHQLTRDESAFVMGLAQDTAFSIRQSNLIDIGQPLGRLGNDGTLAALARVVTDDANTLHVTLAVPMDQRIKFTISRANELNDWAGSLQDSVAPGVTNTSDSFSTAEPSRNEDFRTEVTVLPPELADNFSIIVNMSFDRMAMQEKPTELQSRALHAVATSFNLGLPHQTL